MARLGVLALIATSACSFTRTREPITAQTRNPSCLSARPAIDSAAGATFALAGGTFALLGNSDDDGSMVTSGILMLAASGLFVASAVHGFRDSARCERELLAVTGTQAPPLHVDEPSVAMTCEQRRLDMYTRAVTGADPIQRVRLLIALPSCEERLERERAWVLTRMASLDAGAGRCGEIETIARQVYELDIVLHDVVLISDIEVKHCLMLREL